MLEGRKWGQGRVRKWLLASVISRQRWRVWGRGWGKGSNYKPRFKTKQRKREARS